MEVYGKHDCLCVACQKFEGGKCQLTLQERGYCLCSNCSLEIPEDASICPHYPGDAPDLAQDSGIPEVILEPVHPDFLSMCPSYASEGDSGLDVKSLEDYVITPGETKLFKLGFKMGIPKHPLHELGYRFECQVRPRSGLSMKTGLRVSNAPGTIDNFYVNEVGVLLTNTDSRPYPVAKGDRIAQLVFAQVIRPMRFTIGSVAGLTDRGGGFGHSGK